MEKKPEQAGVKREVDIYKIMFTFKFEQID